MVLPAAERTRPALGGHSSGSVKVRVIRHHPQKTLAKSKAMHAANNTKKKDSAFPTSRVRQVREQKAAVIRPCALGEGGSTVLTREVPYYGEAKGQGQKKHRAERKLPRDRRSSCRACLALHLLPAETRWTDPQPDVGSPVYTALKSPQCPRSSPLTWSVGQPRAYGPWPPCEKDPEPLVCTSGTGRSKSFRSYKVEAPWLCGAHLDTLGASLKDPPAPV